ncbi:MAG TPA: lysophospholipid acyltransferase family protein [Terriglobales bacterium]|nr:lysophospholipid acyltransferase family protein [Terriglobales bacterium]
MEDFEKEYRKIEKSVLRISRLLLLPKKIELRGAENFITAGPNIITANHIGNYKDIAVLLLVKPRMIYFTANKMIFDKEEASELVLRHLHRHMGKFGGFIHLLLSPFYSFMVRFVTSHAANVGSIPVDLYGKRNAAILKCQDYLRKGRAVIVFQGRGRVDDTDPNPYVKPFRRGAAIMAYNLYKEEKLAVPVTPLSIFGTHVMWGVPERVRVKVGPPMFISDFWGGSEAEVVDRFRAALEQTVSRLLMESLAW